MPDVNRLLDAQQTLSHISLQREKSQKSLSDALSNVHLQSGSNTLSSSAPSTSRSHHPCQIYHLQTISTSLVVPQGDWRAMHALALEFVKFVQWTKKMIDDGRKVLVHGFDGYVSPFSPCFRFTPVRHSPALPLS